MLIEGPKIAPVIQIKSLMNQLIQQLDQIIHHNQFWTSVPIIGIIVTIIKQNINIKNNRVEFRAENIIAKNKVL